MTESVDTQKPGTESNEEATKKNKGGFIDFISWIVTLLVILWNWDGFWQTDIEWLSTSQQSMFSVKFAEEQLKVSRITDNNKIIAQSEQRFEAIKEENVQLTDQKFQAEKALKHFQNIENEKCRYYDTALRMLDHLSDKYSEQELKRTIRCTSAECEQILENRALAQKVCTTDSVSSNYGQ